MFLIVFCSTGPSVGLAWLDKLCTTGSTVDPASKQYVSGTAVSSITNTEWKVVAHEIGHSKFKIFLHHPTPLFFQISALYTIVSPALVIARLQVVLVHLLSVFVVLVEVPVIVKELSVRIYILISCFNLDFLFSYESD